MGPRAGFGGAPQPDDDDPREAADRPAMPSDGRISRRREARRNEKLSPEREKWSWWPGRGHDRGPEPGSPEVDTLPGTPAEEALFRPHNPVTTTAAPRRPQTRGTTADRPARPPQPWDEEIIDRPIDRFEPRPIRAAEYVPDLIADGWSAGELTVRLASVRGYAHRHDGLPRQDDAVVAVHRSSGIVLAAVADGVSAAPMSHLGSRHVTRRAVRAMLRHLDDYGQIDWGALLDGVAGSLETYAGQTAQQLGVQAASAEDLMGTTLVLALVVPDAGGAFVHLAQVGDSGAWMLGPDGFTPLLEAKTAAGAQIVDSAVTAMPRRPVSWRHDHARLDPGQVLLLGTDGFGDPLGDGTGLVGDLFARELRSPPRPLRFAHLLDFSRETFDDDRTLVGVWPGEATGAGRR